MTIRRVLLAKRSLCAALLTATLFGACTSDAAATASFAQVKSEYRPSDTLVLDRHGEVLQRVRTDASVRRGQWTTLADVSPALRTALVMSEDKRFYEHSGVDWSAVSAAAWSNLWNRKTRGASTITMQLAGLLDEDLQRGAGGRSVFQKLGQTVSAQWLERDWRKDQILEAYLNLVPFRGELVGIDALSQTLFGKAPHGLDATESAVTAALVRAPNAKAAQVAQRACGVLRLMQTSVTSTTPPTATTAAPAANCDGIDLMVDNALQGRQFAPSQGIAPHAALAALRPLGKSTAKPTSIRTTLDAGLQRFAVTTLEQQLRELQARNVEDGALVVLDNASGEVLAWVGSSGELSSAQEVDGVTALRQPGSTLKPFLYAQAIAERRLTAASLLDDSGTQIQTSGGLYIPQNYDRHFKGWVSARTALGASLNVPAVRTLVMVSPDAFHRQLVRIGLPLKETGDYFGYSLALGSAEVSLLNLTNAYRALGNGGRFGPTTLVPMGTGVNATAGAGERAGGAASNNGGRTSTTSTAPTTAALDERAAFIVGNILSDSNARARTFGTDSILATRFWTAVKTGTSKDMRDNWAIGYSQRYTVGVWVGNASGAPMWDVSGTTGAAPIWAAVMNYLHRSTPSRAPMPPAGVVQAAVSFAPDGGDGGATRSNASALEAPRMEWFIQGTQQPRFAMQPRAPGSTARITAPANGSIIALDPDIPATRQRLSLQAEGSGLRWMVDGKDFAKGNSAQWLPWPGRHVVSLVNAKGETLDTVRIEVRGAGVVKVGGAR